MNAAVRFARRLFLGALLPIPVAWAAARAEPIRIVAAENVYGDICKQIGGDDVAVESILSNPNQDPHEFEASASVARDIARAQLIVYNGAGYDPWMPKLVAASPSPSRTVIDIAQLLGRKSGDNPHFWYDPAAMSVLAGALTDALARMDPSRRGDYAARHAAFAAAMRVLGERIDAFRRRHAGKAITATEPVFDYMADALGLVTRNRRFQLAVMNGTEPSAKDIAAFESDLRNRTVRTLIFNTQTGGGVADRMRRIAISSNVAVVGVAEILPAGSRYQGWMQTQIDALDRALANR
jgi:zinc/manganese transport system substrate-binding protein